MKRPKAEHGSNDAPDCPMVPLHNIVQVLHLTQFNWRAGIDLNALDRSGVGTILVNGDLIGQAVLSDGALEISPLAADQHVVLIHPPTVADQALAATNSCGKHRQDLKRPAVDERVIDERTVLMHHLLDVPQAQRISVISAHAGEHDLEWIMQSLENLV